MRSKDAAVDSAYAKIGSALQKNGYISAGRMLMSNAKVFGSGFVFQSASGNRYVVTNNHVVNVSTMVSLEFQTQEGVKLYEHCKVLYTDRMHDIALVAVPADAGLVALQAYTLPLKDGMDVRSAGYPALGANPLWQFGQGIISNAEVNTGNYGDKDSIIVMQHTAQVDAGNSGGPLLVRHIVSGDTTYNVIGVNTWKAKWRENTNFSIRITDLEQVILNYEQGVTVASIPDLEDVAAEYIKAVNEGYKHVAEYVSSELVLSLPAIKVESLLKMADTEISNMIRSYDPITGIKMLVAKELCGFGKASDYEINNVDDADNYSGSVCYGIKKKEVRYGWQYGDNGWQIVSSDAISSMKANIAYTTDGIFYTDIRHMVGAMIKVPLHPVQAIGVYAQYHYCFLGYGLYYADLGLQGVHMATGNEDEPYESKARWGFSFNMGIGGQLPFQFSDFSLIPYFKIGAGIEAKSHHVGDFMPTILFLLKPGLRLGYTLKNGNQVYLSGEYEYRITNGSIMARMRGVEDDTFHHGFGIAVGFAWK